MGAEKFKQQKSVMTYIIAADYLIIFVFRLEVSYFKRFIFYNTLRKYVYIE